MNGSNAALFGSVGKVRLNKQRTNSEKGTPRCYGALSPHVNLKSPRRQGLQHTKILKVYREAVGFDEGVTHEQRLVQRARR